jgi:hypothetical protein
MGAIWYFVHHYNADRVKVLAMVTKRSSSILKEV